MSTALCEGTVIPGTKQNNKFEINMKATASVDKPFH
jgi:hypothetical protein